MILNHDSDQDQDSRKRRNILQYYISILLILMVANAVFFPRLLQRQVKEVDYSTFLEMVDGDQVEEVMMNDAGSQIVFMAKSSEGGTGGESSFYKTGVFPDDDLRARLEEHNVKFGSQIPQQNSPLLNFILTWILPFIVLTIFGQLMMRSLESLLR